MRISLGVQTLTGSIGVACLEIIAGYRAVQLMEIDVVLVAATQSEFGLGYPGAKGLIPGNLSTPVGVGESGLQVTRVARSWGTPPTVPAAFLRRTTLVGAIGSTWSVSFDDFKADKPNGLLIPANTSLVLWNITAGALADVSLVLEEKWGQQ